MNYVNDPNLVVLVAPEAVMFGVTVTKGMVCVGVLWWEWKFVIDDANTKCF